jgi:hypothetical protein
MSEGGVTGSPLVPAPRKCTTPGCMHAVVEPVHKPDAIDQSTGTLPGWVFRCECGWTRIDPVWVVLVGDGPARFTNGWTSSVTPCRRSTDVLPR